MLPLLVLRKEHAMVNLHVAKSKLIFVGICIISWTYLISPFTAWSDDEAHFKKAISYTVEVTVHIQIPFMEDSQGFYEGAGFLVDKKRGWIVTNAHVASKSPVEASVIFKDGDPILGKVLYVDPYLDLANIEIPPETISKDRFEATLKCDGMPKVGHPVGAFGHPWDFPYTGTKGIISGDTSHFGRHMLQTDAPINYGNSGGPLISLQTGKVVGINTMSVGADDDQNTNFAEPITYVCRVLGLLKRGKDPSPVKITFNFLIDPFKGDTFIISNIYHKNDLIDIKIDDKILRVIGEDPIKNEGELVHALRGKADNFSLDILRNGTQKMISGKLETHDLITKRKGILVSGMLISNRSMTRDDLVINLPKFNIHFIQPGSSAEKALINKEDYLESISGKAFHSLEGIYTFLKEQEGKEVKIKVSSFDGSDESYYLTHYEHILPIDDLILVGGVLEEKTK